MNRLIPVVSILGLAVSSMVFAVPAHAEEPDPFADFTAIVPTLDQDLQDQPSSSTTSIDEAVGLLSVSSAGSADVVAVAPSGVEAIEHSDGITSLTVPRAGDTVQALASLASADSPEEIKFDVGGKAYQDENGEIKILSTGGTTYSVLPPWAQDADGKQVPTSYDIRGGDIVQIVSHHDGAYTYPIVADPFAFVALFSNIHRDTYHGDYRYNGTVTFGGGLILGGLGPNIASYAAGQYVFLHNGWDEWKAKYPAVTNKATLFQQYACHVSASSPGLVFTGEYNIERYRANKPNWLEGIVSHHCNW